MGDFKIYNLEIDRQTDYMYICATESGDDNMVGFLCFLPEDDILTIKYIHVNKPYRRRGVATAMFNSFLEAAGKLGNIRVRAVVPDEPAFLPMINFFSLRSEIELTKLPVIRRISPAERRASVEWNKLVDMDSDSEEFYDSSKKEQNRFMIRNHIYVDPSLPYDRRLCRARIKDGEIRAAAMAGVIKEKEVLLSGVYGSSSEALMVLSSFAKIFETENPEADLIIYDGDDKMISMMKLIFKDEGRTENVWVAGLDIQQQTRR